MYQLIQGACEYNDSVRIKLLYGNVSEKDILLKKELDQLAYENPSRFTVKYIVDKPIDDDKWQGYTGYINRAIIKE